MLSFSSLFPLLLLFSRRLNAQNFTIIGGQILTPGLAIVDAPQPYTPLGGDFLQVALDVSGDGKLQLPPYPSDAATQIFNITIFLSSYDTGRNLTISNGTASTGNASLGEIMDQEAGSTVKHVNWNWPDCLVGNGQPDGSNSSRGAYNVSIRQNFRLNGTNYYTIFDLPISVTNEIDESGDRPSCDSLNNELLSESELSASASNLSTNPFAEGSGVDTGSNSSDGNGGSGLGNPKPEATPGSGLGSSAAISYPFSSSCGLWAFVFATIVFL